MDIEKHPSPSRFDQIVQQPVAQFGRVESVRPNPIQAAPAVNASMATWWSIGQTTLQRGDIGCPPSEAAQRLGTPTVWQSLPIFVCHDQLFSRLPDELGQRLPDQLCSRLLHNWSGLIGSAAGWRRGSPILQRAVAKLAEANVAVTASWWPTSRQRSGRALVQQAAESMAAEKDQDLLMEPAAL